MEPRNASNEISGYSQGPEARGTRTFKKPNINTSKTQETWPTRGTSVDPEAAILYGLKSFFTRRQLHPLRRGAITFALLHLFLNNNADYNYDVSAGLAAAWFLTFLAGVISAHR